MSENMTKKPRRSQSSGGAVKHPAILHGPSTAFDKLVAEIDPMFRTEVRERLEREFGVDPDLAVKRLKSTIDDTLDTLRRRHHQPQTLSIVPAGRGVIAAAGALSIVEGLRAAESRDAALSVLSEAFEHLGVEADALRDHCAGPDAAWPLIERVYAVAAVVAGDPALWKPLAEAHARLASRLGPAHQCLFVRGVHERLENDGVSPTFVAELRRSLARVVPANDLTH